MSLPTTGQNNWGVPLNQYITNVVLAQANAAAAGLTSHQAAADPHGDRAYALGLVAPLTSGVNGPNGFLQLNGAGRIPSSTLPTGGGRSSTFDAIKDYSAPTNGTDATTAIQNALTAAGAVGGGEVWIGDGNFGISLPLYVPSGVWLHLSPGATMTRLVNGGTGTAPSYFVANFTTSTGSGASNILIEGGKWVFDGQAAAGIPMAFVNGDSIVVRNTSIRTLAQSPCIMFAGCTNSAANEVEYSTATPSGARSAYSSAPPAVRIEVAASSVISGLNAAIYTGLGCTNVTVRGGNVTGATNSDGTGVYTAFGGLVGTTAAVASVFHENIIVTDSMCTAFPYNATYPVNWQTCTISNNQFGLNNGTDAAPTWNPSAPGVTNQIITNNLQTVSTANLKAYYTSNSSGRTGTSLSNDGTLQVTVVANAVYEVRANIMYSCPSNAPGIKWDFSLPSGSMNYSANRVSTNLTFYYNGGNLVSEVVQDTAGTFDTAYTNSGANLAIQILGLLQVSSTGGTFAFQWCQQSNQPAYSVVLQAGSYIYLTRVA